MNKKIAQIKKSAISTRGAGFVEYIILVGLVALFCIVAYQAFGGNVSSKVQEQGGKVMGIGG